MRLVRKYEKPGWPQIYENSAFISSKVVLFALCTRCDYKVLELIPQLHTKIFLISYNYI